MKISSSDHSEDWWKLNLEDPGSEDWAKAIEIFACRIRERFIIPVAALIEHEKTMERDKRRCGFVIMAIDCLLIETLQAFRWGKLLSEYDPRETPLIIRFLQRSPHFQWAEWRSRRFYNDYRNGILHQAETKGDSLIRSEGPLVIGEEEDNGLIINRTKFHELVSLALDDYIDELHDSGKSTLRANFRKKMNEVCRDNPLARKHPRNRS